MNEFPTVSIEHLAAPHKGAIKIGPFGSQLKKSEMVLYGVKVYGQENVILDDFTIGERRISANKFEMLKSCELNESDVLVTMMGTIGKCAVFPSDAERGIMDSHLLRIQPDPALATSEFLALTLTAETVVLPQIRRLSHGSIMSGLSSNIVRRLEIPLPSVSEQQRIVEILGTVDQVIRSTEHLIAKLEQVKQGLLHDLLTRGINESGALRDARRHPEQFTDTALGSLPRDWAIQPCGDLCREIVVGIVIRPTQWYAPSGVPVLRSANVREDGIDMSDLMFMTAAHHRALSKSAVSPGDVVTVRTGYPGTTAVIPDSVAEANCVDIIISRPGPRLLPQYLSTWVNAPIGKGQVLAKQGGLAQQHFNIGEMKELLVAVPPLTEQRAICACATTMERRVGDEQGLLRKLTALKSGLIDDLLTGRVRVAIDEDAA
jgi:type I restriction enzyme S subunit